MQIYKKMGGGADQNPKKEPVGKNVDLETCLSRNINYMNSEKSRDRQSQMSPDKLSISGGSIIKIEQHSARNLSGLGTMRITGHGV